MSVYILSLLVPRHLSRHAQLTHRAERDHCQRQLSHGLSPFPVDPVRNAKVALYELPTLQVSFPWMLVQIQQHVEAHALQTESVRVELPRTSRGESCTVYAIVISTSVSWLHGVDLYQRFFALVSVVLCSSRSWARIFFHGLYKRCSSSS